MSGQCEGLHGGENEGELCKMAEEFKVVNGDVSHFVGGRDKPRTMSGGKRAAPEMKGAVGSPVDPAHAHAQGVMGALACWCRMGYFKEVCGACSEG